ncbi:MAG: glycogen synthase [Clostridiales bacterium]|nr:glycogen synthase [Clostridiales bacterium]
MKILYVASEALPFVSTGGLADVVGSLPAAVRRAMGTKTTDVRVVIPMYPKVKSMIDDKFELVDEGSVHLSWREQYCGIWKTVRGGVTFYFIDNEYYFTRNCLYGEFDDAERFAYFGKAVIRLMEVTGFIPDIMHANDWQSALAVIYLKQTAGRGPLGKVRVLFTIHNIEYQGKYDMALLGDVFALGPSDRQTVEYNGLINLLKGAIVCADKVSTVSERYSNEILTEYYSSGLHHILRASRDKLTGITNGIDTEYYNPAKDTDIVKKYSVRDISGKAANKAELRSICGFGGDESAPIITMVSRLTGHKGFDLVRRVMGDILDQTNVCFAVLGTGEPEYENFFREMAWRRPDRIAVRLEYNKALSKKFYAGGDMFLMPSKSEPCGLSQMIASRYGNVPIVRETGGLYDTVKPFNEYTGEGNGFSFTNYNAHDMLAVIKYAIGKYYDKNCWDKIVHNVMSVDFSWNASAVKYAQLYESMLDY